jgi:hypothetical protein
VGGGLHLVGQDRARRRSFNRDLIIGALLGVGFSNCRDEWWHWSYGDSAWSVRTGCAVAVYGLIAPPAGYTFVPRRRPLRVGWHPVGRRATAPRLGLKHVPGAGVERGPEAARAGLLEKGQALRRMVRLKPFSAVPRRP